MVRSFDRRPLGPGVVDRLLAIMTRTPSAGFTQGTEVLVLEGPEQTGRYWDACLPDSRRAAFAWPGLLQAPLLVVPMASRGAYLVRYAESDKGWADRDAARWPVPYWYVDAGFCTLLALLGAVDAGLGAALFKVVDPGALRSAFGVPDLFEPVGAVAIGYPGPDRPSSSSTRRRRPDSDVIHRGGW